MILSLVAWVSPRKTDFRWGLHTDAGVPLARGNDGLSIACNGPKRMIESRCCGNSLRERRSLMNHYIAGVVAANNGDLNSIRVIGG